MFARNPNSKADNESDRHGKSRFPIQRDLRYKLVKDTGPSETGAGQTLDIGSGGISFAIGHDLPEGACVELSISWPVLLNENCAVRLVVIGRVVRNEGGRCDASVDKWEFRTQARVARPAAHDDAKLQRWAGLFGKDSN
jgi:hypothetical protein